MGPQRRAACKRRTAKARQTDASSAAHSLRAAPGEQRHVCALRLRSETTCTMMRQWCTRAGVTRGAHRCRRLRRWQRGPGGGGGAGQLNAAGRRHAPGSPSAVSYLQRPEAHSRSVQRAGLTGRRAEPSRLRCGQASASGPCRPAPPRAPTSPATSTPRRIQLQEGRSSVRPQALCGVACAALRRWRSPSCGFAAQTRVSGPPGVHATGGGHTRAPDEASGERDATATPEAQHKLRSCAQPGSPPSCAGACARCWTARALLRSQTGTSRGVCTSSARAAPALVDARACSRASAPAS